MRLVIRIAAGILIGLWIGFALLFSLYSGFSAASFLSGLRVGPAMVAERVQDSVSPDRHFGGIENPRALAVLRRDFGHGVTGSDGRLLYNLIVEKGYTRALEIGTASGYSTLWFALAMQKTGGKVTTIEIDPAIAAEARENFRQAGLDGLIDSRTNDALREIPALAGEFDFVFMDTGGPLNKQLLDLLYSRITPGGAITAHNAIGFRSHQPDFLRLIENDPLLDTRIVPTTSGGISVTIKKAASKTSRTRQRA